jgi:hypothetical protein
VYVACAAALLIVDPPHGHSWLLGLAAAGVLCIASRVQFDTPFGFTAATQLAFVPLLFAVPVTLVPVLVPAVLIAARLPEVARGGYQPARLIKEISNSWFALGPVAVLVLSGTRPDHAGAAILILALAAQLVVDALASTVRCGARSSGRRASRRSCATSGSTRSTPACRSSASSPPT